MDLTIRRADLSCIDDISALLLQVHRVHSEKRPDIFRVGSKKYTQEELRDIIADDSRPIFVAKSGDRTVGYAFCIISDTVGDKSLEDRRTLYIDDLCVDENLRGSHIGEGLYKHVLNEAKILGCDSITLNVWCLNSPAMRFYEKMGLEPLKITMEKVL